MKIELKQVNNFLVAAIVLVNFYVIATPFMPSVDFWFKQRTNKLQSLTLRVSSMSEPIPEDNRLVIPSLLLDTPIYDGESPYTVNKGVWRLPKTSTPDKDSNTVLVGHRFTYHAAAVFYHLDLMKTGDEFALYWEGKKYLYKVSQVKVVRPSEISVEAPTNSPILTLYTCTPLWTAKDRLVVVAERVREKANNE